MPTLTGRFIRRTLPSWITGVPPTTRYAPLDGSTSSAPPPYEDGSNGHALPEGKTEMGIKLGVPPPEEPPSRSKVIASVSFYLVAALVVSFYLFSISDLYLGLTFTDGHGQ